MIFIFILLRSMPLARMYYILVKEIQLCSNEALGVQTFIEAYIAKGLKIFSCTTSPNALILHFGQGNSTLFK